jgi:hypothetical protein
MKARKQITLLAICAGALLLVYLLTLFFDPERVASRNAAFTWLPAQGRDLADRIEISGAGESLTLVRQGGAWFAQEGAELFPVKQGRIDDLFRLLSTKGAFPRRGSSASSLAAVGLAEGAATKLAIRGGAGAEPLLALLVGGDDASGRECYLRKSGENEYRSGDRLIKTYATTSARDWYDLKLFAENRADLVQRVQVNSPQGETWALQKSGDGWQFADGGAANKDAVESYLRTIFDIQADDFYRQEFGSEAPQFTAGSIRLELGDGSAMTVQAAAPNEGKVPATVSGSRYAYLLSEGAVKRLFREKASLQ